jgi:hypothetical protein
MRKTGSKKGEEGRGEGRTEEARMCVCPFKFNLGLGGSRGCLSV